MKDNSDWASNKSQAVVAAAVAVAAADALITLLRATRSDEQQEEDEEEKEGNETIGHKYINSQTSALESKSFRRLAAL